MAPLSRRRLLTALVAAPAGLLLAPRRARAEHYPALLCADCGFGAKKDQCARCGRWLGGTRIPARLCGEHGFGGRKDNCCVCGKWVGSTRQRAYVGECCGFGSAKDTCVICGRWAP